MILVLFFLFSAFAAFCGLLIYGYRSRAHSAEARANRAEGALEVSQHNLNVVAEIARECVKGIGLNAKEIVPDEVLNQSAPRDEADVKFDRALDILQSAEDKAKRYTPQVVAFCSACSVSVRHPPESFPVKCPAIDCGALITLPDDPLDADLIG